MNIVFLANPFSPHVDRWVELAKFKYKLIKIIHVNEKGVQKLNVESERLLPIVLCRTRFLRYILAGIILRYSSKYKNIDLVHAHNASGYGVMALISGKRFIITTYGSEIYRVKESGFLYRLLIKKVLNSAFKITCSTKFMKEFLLRNNLANDNKIFSSTLGISEKYAQAVPKKIDYIESSLVGANLVLFSNRRIHPLYCIEYIISEFNKILIEFDRAKLILLEGDCERAYQKKIRNLVLQLNLQQSVLFVDGFISTSEIKWLYSVSNFSISIPKSDQLSSSILESIYCGVLPILRSLDAYSELFNNKLAYRLENTNPGSVSKSVTMLNQLQENKVSIRGSSLFSEKKIKKYICDVYSC